MGTMPQQPPTHEARVHDAVVARADRDMIARSLPANLGAQVLHVMRGVTYSLAETAAVVEAAVPGSELAEVAAAAELEGLVVLEREPAELLAAVVRQLDRGRIHDVGGSAAEGV